MLVAPSVNEEHNLAKLAYPFKTNQNNRFTKALFHEQYVTIPKELRQTDLEPPFTLFTDKPNYINFGREYIELGDPTGYEIAMKYFRDYAYWTYLMKAPWFQDAKAIWDAELDAKIKSEALRKIREIAAGETPGALQAARYLEKAEYKVKGDLKPKRGRPSSDEVQGALAHEVESQRTLQADLERIRGISSPPTLKAVS